MTKTKRETAGSERAICHGGGQTKGRPFALVPPLYRSTTAVRGEKEEKNNFASRHPNFPLQLSKTSIFSQNCEFAKKGVVQ